MAKRKYHVYVKDGFAVPFNEQLVGNPLYQVVETDGDPNPAEFHAPESDESAEEREAAELARARALVAKADAKEAAERAAAGKGDGKQGK